MADFEPSSRQNSVVRRLSSLTLQETQYLLRYHNMPKLVLDAFRQGNVDGSLLEFVEEVEDFRNINIHGMYAKKILRIIEEAKKSGVPIGWLVDNPSLLMALESTGHEVQDETFSSRKDPQREMESVNPFFSPPTERKVQGGCVRAPCLLADEAESNDGVVCARTSPDTFRPADRTLGPAESPPMESSNEAQWKKAYEMFYQACCQRLAMALVWLEEQSRAGNQFAMAYLMLTLNYFNNDLPKAKQIGAELLKEAIPRWLQSADATEKMHAELIMGKCCHFGLGCDVDMAQAVTWYRKAAEHGLSHAQNMMGYCYDTGQGLSRDNAQALPWYRKAADQGHATSQSNLGACYLYGLGVAADREQAIAWYRRSAAQGFNTAIVALRKLNVSLA